MSEPPPYCCVSTFASWLLRDIYAVVFNKKGEPWYRTATTAYPCYLPVLGELSGSWSYQTHQLQK